MRNISAESVWLGRARRVKEAMANMLSRRPGLFLGATAALFATGIGLFTSFYMGAASFAYFLMVLGIGSRRAKRALHRKLMFAAMGIDFLLVGLLEFQRQAVETVISLNLSPLQLSHVMASTFALALYIPLIILGTKLWNEEKRATRAWHKRLGLAAFVLRSAGFVLMFSLLGRDS